MLQRDVNAERLEAKHIDKMIWLNLAIIAGLSLAVRLGWAFLAPTFDPFLRESPLLGDAASYDRIVKSVLAGTGFTERPPELSAFWPPLYPAFLALVYSIAGYELQAARLAQAFVGSIVPVAFYLIAVKSVGRNVAWLAALGLVFYPFLVYFNAWLIAESLFMGLMSLGLLALSRVTSRSGFGLIAIAGLLFGLAALAKPFMLFVMPFLALWLLVAFPAALSRRILAVIVLAAATLTPIIPWTARNYRVFDQVVLISTNGGYTFLGANNADAWGGHDEGFPPLIVGLNSAEMEEAYYSEALDWIRENPADFVRLLVPKYRRLLSPLSVASIREDYSIPGKPFVYVAYAAFLLTALLGTVRFWSQWRHIGFLYAPIAGVFLSAGLFYGDARYTIPMVPSLVIFAAAALPPLLVKIQQTRTLLAEQV